MIMAKLNFLLAALIVAALVFPLMSAAEYLETKDGAKIYYEDHGKGQPIVLVHGWICSSKFWQKNAPELAKIFRVVTLDLRGHGNSSKTLSGHTIAQYGRDVRDVVDRLDLRNFTLVGWSMGGPVVLSYYEQFGKDGRIKALGLVDSDPFPFSPADWNNHPLHNYNYNAMNATFLTLASDPKKFATGFTNRMFKQKPSDSDVDWVVTEMTKTPPWIAIAIYSDFVMSNYTKTLPTVEIPLLVFAADSGVFPKGIAMGKALAGMAPRGTFVPIEDGGHMLFYEQSEKFNSTLAGFVKRLK
jgi:pimeloyl-ACP methyl ester carboxylesterase